MSIVNVLPGIAPSLRPYSAGVWPQGRMKMRNGRVVRWSLSSRPSGDKMELTWPNITFAQAEEICKIWDANYGIYGQLTLPPEILAGTSGGLSAYIALPFAGATWHFTSAPRVTATTPRRCTLSISIGVRGFNLY
jgi:hypothetical protein